jgi:hypothetical protein
MRRARFQQFLGFIADLRRPVEQGGSPLGHRPIRILDIGGAEPFWASMDDLLAGLDITMVNLHPQTTRHPQVHAIVGNACSLSGIPEQTYDVAFSNSVIEHLGSSTIVSQARTKHSDAVAFPAFQNLPWTFLNCLRESDNNSL